MGVWKILLFYSITSLVKVTSTLQWNLSLQILMWNLALQTLSQG